MFKLLTTAAVLCLITSAPLFANDAVTETFVSYWNAGPDRALQNSEIFTDSFMERNGEDGLAGLMGMLHSDNGNIEFQSLTESSAENVRFLISSENGNWMNIDLKLDTEGRIDGLGVNFAPPPPIEDEVGMSAQQIVSRLENYMEDLASEGGFSGSILLARNFEPVFARSFGLADKDSNRKNEATTPINLGSMNKMFTGIAIGQLVSQGKLDYQDTVGKYLPEYPNERVRNEVTIHQLLTHTSGLGSYWNERYAERKNTLKTQSDFAALFVDDQLLFDPGTGEEYSNAGPVVLGLIIEAITGMDYYEYIRENIYTPAEMTHSDHYDKYENISGKATGYFVPESGSEPISNFENLGRIGSAAGGGYASANDLLNFARALYDGTLLNEDQREVLTTYKVQWGEDEGYGYLFGDHRINKHRYIGHNGGAPGINAEFSHFPELGYTLIVLANTDSAATPVADHVRTWIAYSD